jgi:hypothetical protein
MNWEKCPYMEKVFKIGGQFYTAIIGQFYAALDNIVEIENMIKTVFIVRMCLLQLLRELMSRWFSQLLLHINCTIRELFTEPGSFSLEQAIKDSPG